MTTAPGARQAFQLGPLDDIPVGEGRAYCVNGWQVAVFRLRSGAVRATGAVCPHAGGPLADGTLDGEVVVCPLHSAVFDLETGACTSGGNPIRVYPVEVVDGLVTLPVS